jgi:hypothetical protein
MFKSRRRSCKRDYESRERLITIKPLKKSFEEAAMAPQALRCETLLTPMATATFIA